ncbi:hypothetical protein AB0H20_12590 [Nocardia fluminea]|uniref:hypothetical protein n=1 Tax=Nocardia fluminea TaxID=134984 RepID=UPI0033FB6E36
MAKPDIAQPEERERQQKALALRLAGGSYAAIARTLGYADHSGAYRAVEAVLNRVESEGAAQLRQIEDARLNELLLKVWKSAMEGDRSAQEFALKVHDRRVKLHGLAAPERLVVAQTSPESIAEFATTLAEDFAALGFAEVKPDDAEYDVDPEGDRWANT